MHTFSKYLNFTMDLVEQDIEAETLTAWFALPSGLIMGKVISEKAYMREIQKIHHPESPGDHAVQMQSRKEALDRIGHHNEDPDKNQTIFIQDARIEAGGQHIYMAKLALVNASEICAWGYGYAIPNAVDR
jgi:hypothetical protein